MTSNRFRPPAVLAKIAATVDVVSGGRLNFGIGVGSRPSPPAAWREYPAHGMSFHDFAHAVESFGRDPASIIRSVHLPVSYHQPGSTQGAITEAIDAGFRHIVLGLASPYPAEVAHWVAETFIGPTPCPK